jgi:chromosome segregation ATPase
VSEIQLLIRAEMHAAINPLRIELREMFLTLRGCTARVMDRVDKLIEETQEMNVAVDQLTAVIDQLSNEEGQLKTVVTSLVTNFADYKKSSDEKLAALQAEIADITTHGGVAQATIDRLSALATGLQGDLDQVTALNTQILQPATPPADAGFTGSTDTSGSTATPST